MKSPPEHYQTTKAFNCVYHLSQSVLVDVACLRATTTRHECQSEAGSGKINHTVYKNTTSLYKSCTLQSTKNEGDSDLSLHIAALLKTQPVHHSQKEHAEVHFKKHWFYNKVAKHPIQNKFLRFLAQVKAVQICRNKLLPVPTRVLLRVKCHS